MKNSKQTIEQRVKNLISEKLGIDLDKVVNEAELRDHLGADSLDSIDIIMELEIEFDIMISDEQAEELNTVQQHIDIVKNLFAYNIEVNLQDENVDGRV